ncbi:MAG: amino acid permease, partial [Bacteroidota bacterium]
TAEELITNNLAMSEIASIPILILAGVAASTLSSALGSVLAAPRTLQAISRDRVTPFWMANQMGSPTEPRVAVLLTGVVAVSVIWLGDLDFVAPIITMFFLNTYGMVNLVASIERMVGNPSYRPRFRVPLIVSLLGAVGCYGAMFLINAPATVAAIVISYGIFFALSRRRMVRTWGDVRSGIWTSLARYALLNLEKRDEEAGRNWRPNIVVYTGQPHNRERLVALSEWLSVGRGIVTFVQLITGASEASNKVKLREMATKRIRTYIKDRRMAAFAEAQIVPDFSRGAVSVAQAHGIGAMESNTVLLGWSRTAEGRASQMRLLRDMASLDKSVLFLNVNEERGFGRQKVVNVWWGGGGGNADLMLLLGYLVSRSNDWHHAELRLSRIVESEEGKAQTLAHMNELLEDVRVDATVNIVVHDDPSRSITEVFAQHSQEVDLTVLGMPVPTEDRVETTAERLEEFTEAVGTVLLVYNATYEEEML